MLERQLFASMRSNKKNVADRATQTEQGQWKEGNYRLRKKQ